MVLLSELAYLDGVIVGVSNAGKAFSQAWKLVVRCKSHSTQHTGALGLHVAVGLDCIVRPVPAFLDTLNTRVKDSSYEGNEEKNNTLRGRSCKCSTALAKPLVSSDLASLIRIIVKISRCDDRDDSNIMACEYQPLLGNTEVACGHTAVCYIEPSSETWFRNVENHSRLGSGYVKRLRETRFAFLIYVRIAVSVLHICRSEIPPMVLPTSAWVSSIPHTPLHACPFAFPLHYID